MKEIAEVWGKLPDKERARALVELTRGMPADLATERLLSLALIAVHLCANRARIDDDPKQSRAHVPDDVFVENLVDMTTAALFAPVSLS